MNIALVTLYVSVVSERGHMKTLVGRWGDCQLQWASRKLRMGRIKILHVVAYRGRISCDEISVLQLCVSRCEAVETVGSW
jgi:hypothetical protein